MTGSPTDSRLPTASLGSAWSVVAALAGDHGQARRQHRQAARYTFYYPQEEYRPAFLDALGFCRNAAEGRPISGNSGGG